MKFRDKLGWPVERIKGRSVLNCLRLLIHTNIVQTWRLRNSAGTLVATPSSDVVGIQSPQPGEAE